jgi:hypothetical protein
MLLVDFCMKLQPEGGTCFMIRGQALLITRLPSQASVPFRTINSSFVFRNCTLKGPTG